MYLKEVQIRNFKNFIKERFLFQKGVNVIIGENDSGKTNLMQAIRLVLDKRMDWHEKELTEKEVNKLLYVIASRAKSRLYLFSEKGRTYWDNGVKQYVESFPTRQLITNQNVEYDT